MAINPKHFYGKVTDGIHVNIRFIVANAAARTTTTITDIYGTVHTIIPGDEGSQILQQDTFDVYQLVDTVPAVYKGITGGGTAIATTYDNSGATLVAVNVKTALDELSARATPDNYVATVAPTVSNDNTEGYAIGSEWYDTVANILYKVVDVTTGAAVWEEINFVGVAPGAIDAVDVAYDNSGSALVATNVKTALDELDADVATAEGVGTTNAGNISTNTTDIGTNVTAIATKATGPASSVDNTVPRYDSTTGKLLQTSGIVVDDSDNVSGAVNIVSTGYTEITDIAAPASPADGAGRLYKKSSDDGLFWLPDSAGAEVDLTASGGGGGGAMTKEINFQADFDSSNWNGTPLAGTLTANLWNANFGGGAAPVAYANATGITFPRACTIDSIDLDFHTSVGQSTNALTFACYRHTRTEGSTSTPTQAEVFKTACTHTNANAAYFESFTLANNTLAANDLLFFATSGTSGTSHKVYGRLTIKFTES